MAQDNIAVFNGEIVTKKEEIMQRIASDKGGYIIQGSSKWFLDCYQTAMNGTCKASMANSPLNCFTLLDGNISGAAKANAVLFVQFQEKGEPPIYILRANRKIERKEEILWHYGGSYFRNYK